MTSTLSLVISLVISFAVTALLGYVLIPVLHNLKFGQNILTDIGPNWHAKKQGTPTMGGVIIALTIVVLTLVVFKMFNNNDINYINDAISDFSSSLLTKLRTLSPGSCILFGTAFKMPIIAIVDRPNPTPKSDNCNIGNTWYIN